MTSAVRGQTDSSWASGDKRQTRRSSRADDIVAMDMKGGVWSSIATL